LCSAAKEKHYGNGKMWTITLITHVTIKSTTIEAIQKKNLDQSVQTDVDAAISAEHVDVQGMLCALNSTLNV